MCQASRCRHCCTTHSSSGLPLGRRRTYRSSLGLCQRSHRNCQALRRPIMPQAVLDSKTTRDGARGLSLALHLLEGWHRRSTHLENCATARYNEGTRDGARGRPLRRLHAPFLLLSLPCSLVRSPCPCHARPHLAWVISLPTLEQMVRHHQHLSHHRHERRLAFEPACSKCLVIGSEG